MYAKVIKEIGKPENRKRKGENKIKMEKGPGEPIWPGLRISPWPN
jgi:hypothetical protein